MVIQQSRVAQVVLNLGSRCQFRVYFATSNPASIPTSEIDMSSMAPGGPFFCTMNRAPDFNINGAPDERDMTGDFDGDGMITESDVTGFIDSLLLDAASLLGDFNGDGVCDGDDIQDFVTCLLGGPCP